METRIDPRKAAPEVYRAMLALESAVRATGLESNLLDLVRLRASQINGCAFCIDMHSKDLRAEGESEAAALPAAKPGERHPSTPTVSGRRWHGPRR